MEKSSLKIFADYSQFVICDKYSDDDIFGLWNEDTAKKMLIVGRDVIAVGTVRNHEVPVEIEILDSPPIHDNFEVWDKISECSINIPSGSIVVMGTTDYFPDAPRFSVEPGTYRVRIYYGDLQTVSSDGLEGDDHYKVTFWKSETDDGIKFIK